MLTARTVARWTRDLALASALGVTCGLVYAAGDAHAAECPPRVTVAHRTFDGQPGLENTLEGARRSLTAGVRAVEVDVWRTAPEPSPVTVRGRKYPAGARELVLIHDNDTDRTHGTHRIVANTPWSVLAGLRTIDGQPTATLREMLAYVHTWPGRGVMVQLKGTEHFDAPAIARLFDSYGVDHKKAVVYKSDYRGADGIDRAILADFVAAGFVTGLKTVALRLPPVSDFTSAGFRFAAISATNYNKPPGSPERDRILAYKAAGLVLSNLAPVSPAVVQLANVLVLHTEDLTTWKRYC